ncbi:MAG: hypothetical protein AB1757_16120 [Acidobacteriota bacterium]
MNNRAIKLTILLTVVLSAFVFVHPGLTANNAEAESQRRPSTTRRPTAASKPGRSANYSQFSHQVAAHQMACNSCHKFPTANWKTARKGEEAFEDVTDYPTHDSCLNCHRQQFFKGAQPAICTICHTNPGPRNSNRHPFPNPSEVFDQSPKGKAAVSQFEIFFPHDKHESLFGELRKRSASLQFAAFRKSRQGAANAVCANCHQLYKPQGEASDEFVTPPPKNLKDDDFWLKKGTFMSSPGSHASCFSCHAAGGGLQPEPTDCSMCHKLSPASKLTLEQSDFDAKFATAMAIQDKPLLERWQRRQASKFRHEWFSHAELKCTDCHKVATINTADGRGAEVDILSCGGSGSGCHITPTADEGGALNFEIDQRKAKADFQCSKCHLDEGRKAIPESHAKALSAITKK